jgi:hypothetical protein
VWTSSEARCHWVNGHLLKTATAPGRNKYAARANTNQCSLARVGRAPSEKGFTMCATIFTPTLDTRCEPTEQGFVVCQSLSILREKCNKARVIANIQRAHAKEQESFVLGHYDCTAILVQKERVKGAGKCQHSESTRKRQHMRKSKGYCQHSEDTCQQSKSHLCQPCQHSESTCRRARVICVPTQRTEPAEHESFMHVTVRVNIQEAQSKGPGQDSGSTHPIEPLIR